MGVHIATLEEIRRAAVPSSRVDKRGIHYEHFNHGHYLIIHVAGGERQKHILLLIKQGESIKLIERKRLNRHKKWNKSSSGGTLLASE